MEKIDEGFSVNYNTIELYEKTVTLFYSLATGDIKLYAGGIQYMDFLEKIKTIITMDI